MQNTSAKMCIDTHVSRSARQALSLSIWYVLLCHFVAVEFCHAKIHNEYVALLC